MGRISINCIKCKIEYSIKHNLEPPARFIKVVSHCPNCNTKTTVSLEASLGGIECPECNVELNKHDGFYTCPKCDKLWKKCAYRFCEELFTPTVSPPSRHKYHTVECRLLENTLVDIKRKVKRTKKAKRCHKCGIKPVAKGNYWLCETCYRYGGNDEEHKVLI